MIQYWEKSEFEEVIGQGAKLALMVYADPDNATLWAKLKAWAEDNKSFVNNDSYEAPAPTGYDVTKVDEGYEDKSYGIERLDFKQENLNF